MKKIIKIICTFLCLALLLGGLSPAYSITAEAASFHEIKNVSSFQTFEPVWKSQTPFEHTDDTKKACYIVKKNYCAVRTAPSEKTGKIINRLHTGEYLFGEVVTNKYNNRWLKYYDPIEKEYFFVYIGNLEEHDTHTWYAIEDNDTGWYGYCDCGYVHFEYYNNSKASFSFDSVEILKQVALGNYSESYSLTAAIASIALGLTPVGTLMDIRDLSADAINCVKGSCNISSLVLDMTAFIPFIDAAKYADNLRAIKQLENTDEIYANTYKELRKIFKGKSAELGIEIHHLLEKRFGDLIDVAADDFLAKDLLRSEHRAITNAFREKFPYGTEYTSISLREIQDAIKEIYADCPELRDQTLSWVAEHWIGRK